MKGSGSSDHDEPKFKKRTQTQEEPKIAKVKFQKGGVSQNKKPTYASCGKRQYKKYLAGTSGCFGCERMIIR